MKNIAKVCIAVMLAALTLLSEQAFAAHGNAKVEVKITKQGDGATAVRHSKVKMHYTGWLLDGTKFDSSRDRGKPFEFTLGAGQVIPGWDMGIEGMKVGGKRELMIPADLAYGKKGAGGVIPPNATLKFEVELIALEPPKYENIGNGQLKALLARGVKIVDLRRAEEWKQTGVVKGSELLTAFDGRGQFNRAFPAAFTSYAAPEEEVILICRTGSRSAGIANMLAEQANYTKVYNVTNGIEKWLKDGNPVVR